MSQRRKGAKATRPTPTPTYHPKKTPSSNALTDLIMAVLRLSALAHKTGGGLVRDLGLSSTRWQTLGEICAATEPVTVSLLARRLGLSRQAVQRLANAMAADGMVTFVPNPADRRADHVVLTNAGRNLYRRSLDREWAFTNAVSDGFDADALARAAALIDAVTKKMEEQS
jgi:DNA-binding MarR family transcriptional regulator